MVQETERKEGKKEKEPKRQFGVNWEENPCSAGKSNYSRTLSNLVEAEGT